MVFESTVWLGVRSAHTLWHVSDEEQRQTERIGSENVRLISSQALQETFDLLPIERRTV